MRGNWLRHTLGLHQQEIDGKKCVILWVQAFIFEIVLHPLMRRCHLASGAVCIMFFFFFSFFFCHWFSQILTHISTSKLVKRCLSHFPTVQKLQILLSIQESKKQIIIYSSWVIKKAWWNCIALTRAHFVNSSRFPISNSTYPLVLLQLNGLFSGLWSVLLWAAGYGTWRSCTCWWWN